MEVYSSYANMMERLTEVGWREEKTVRGKVLYLDPNEGDGTFTSWGNETELAFVDLDLTYKETNLILNYSDIVGVQITFIEDNAMEYYKNEEEKESTHFGTFCYVNNTPIPWFKKYPANERVRGLTLFVCDAFLKKNGIDLSHEDWNRLARTINSRNISLPTLSAILKQIRHTEISEDLFQVYFKTKAIEAFLLLWNYSKSQEEHLSRINSKSHTAVKDTLHLLSKDFVSPPIITDIAKIVGIDKKTLQYAFREIVGLSIHKYIRTLKMQQALLLLKDSNFSIEKIAKEVGYNSKIHFYNAFDEVFGMKPLEMKNLLCK